MNWISCPIYHSGNGKSYHYLWYFFHKQNGTKTWCCISILGKEIAPVGIILYPITFKVSWHAAPATRTSHKEKQHTNQKIHENTHHPQYQRFQKITAVVWRCKDFQNSSTVTSSSNSSVQTPKKPGTSTCLAQLKGTSPTRTSRSRWRGKKHPKNRHDNGKTTFLRDILWVVPPLRIPVTTRIMNHF